MPKPDPDALPRAIKHVCGRERQCPACVETLRELTAFVAAHRKEWKSWRDTYWAAQITRAAAQGRAR